MRKKQTREKKDHSVEKLSYKLCLEKLD